MLAPLHRRPLWYTSGLLVLLVVGCGRKPATGSAERSTDATPSSTPSRAVPVAAFPADTSCGFDAQTFYGNPRELLEEFLRRDANGEFFRSSRWYSTAYTCPNHTPGWDEATLISSYSVSQEAIADTIATYSVSYQTIGRLTQDAGGGFVIESPGTRRGTFVLLRTVAGWRIASPIQHQHALPRGALTLQHLKPEARARITELVK